MWLHTFMDNIWHAIALAPSVILAWCIAQAQSRRPAPLAAAPSHPGSHHLQASMQAACGRISQTGSQMTQDPAALCRLPGWQHAPTGPGHAAELTAFLAGSRAGNMRPPLLAGLLKDPEALAKRILRLKELLPDANISSMAAKEPGLLLKVGWGVEVVWTATLLC